MSVQTMQYPACLNGQRPDAAALLPLAFAGFAHFTAMQVRNGTVKGLDLHLARLRAASLRLFGAAMPNDAVLEYIRLALPAGPRNLSLTVTMYAGCGEFTAAGKGHIPDILVRTAPPSDGPAGPMRLSPVEHERFMADIKHVGEGAKTYYLHRAVEQGYDDAVFVDRHGHLSEATIWNLALWDGDTVVWPQADILGGTMMGVVQRQLEKQGVPQQQRPLTLADLGRFSGAAIMNSWTPGVPVTVIGAQAFGASWALVDILRSAYDAEPAVHI